MDEKLRKFMADNNIQECPDCEGKGWYWVTTDISYGGRVSEDKERCERCGGTGEIEIEAHE